jgi:hypothetical protein
MRLFLSLGFVATLIIVSCMIYLLKVGVALRTQPLIKPSLMKSEEHSPVARAVSERLLPVLRETPYMLLGFAPLNEFRGPLFQKLLSESERLLNKKIQVLDGLASSERDLLGCPYPCWILLPVEKANDLDANSWIELNLEQKSRVWASLTALPFSRKNLGMREECRNQKKISFSCLTEISLEEVRRKLDKISEKAFFMRGYLEKNYFIFYEKSTDSEEGK